MKAVVLAALVATAVLGPTRAQPADAAAERAAPRPAALDGQIAGLKQALRLTQAQERNWPPVEAALRALARRLPGSESIAFASAVDQTELYRLVTVAMPLVRTLDADQKRDAIAFLRRMGFTPVSALL